MPYKPKVLCIKTILLLNLDIACCLHSQTLPTSAGLNGLDSPQLLSIVLQEIFFSRGVHQIIAIQSECTKVEGGWRSARADTCQGHVPIRAPT